MEKDEILKKIEQIEDYRHKLMRRNNLLWRLKLDEEGGYKVIADNRRLLLESAQRDLDIVEQSAMSLIAEMRQRYSLHPRDNALRLICMYIDLIEMDPFKMEKHRQKITALRRKVLGYVDELDTIRQESSLFS